MRAPRLVTALLLALVPALSAAGEASVYDLEWLSGCWAGLDAERGSGEQWTAPAGGTMLGVSRAVRDGQTVAHEFMLIRQAEGGSLELVALPSGQARAVFPAIRLTGREVIFENPAHDFPQRVIYRTDGKGGLQARIEGLAEGEPRAVSFPMKRIACDEDS